MFGKRGIETICYSLVKEGYDRYSGRGNVLTAGVMCSDDVKEAVLPLCLSRAFSLQRKVRSNQEFR